MTPVYKSLFRPPLLMGGDRELIIISGAIFLALPISSQSLVITGCCIVLWLITIFTARRMAKKDPMLRHIYLKSLAYQAVYPAKASPWQSPKTGFTGN